MIPISTAPYVIEDYEAGRFVSLKRDEDYWGKMYRSAEGQTIWMKSGWSSMATGP